MEKIFTDKEQIQLYILNYFWGHYYVENLENI